MSKSIGLVILYEDLTHRWIEWAKEGKLTNIGVHKLGIPGDAPLEKLFSDLNKPQGRAVIDELEKAGICVEYELHSAEWMLPRELFKKDKTLFRENEEGERIQASNFCPSSTAALEIITESAYKAAEILKQNSHRYFLWPDDLKKASCHCSKCKANGYSGADMNMLYSNALVKGLRAYDSEASASYIAYADAKSLPHIMPDKNVFLEFAPMDRDHNKPMNDPNEKRGRDYIRLLDDLLKIFRAEDAHVLEYWLDNAMYSGLKKPPVKVPFNTVVADRDVELYTSMGIYNIKSFGSFIDEEYYLLHGNPPIKEYGEIVSKYVH